ncbi:unnamed protein product [Rotaria sp. Silwood1]|nr:unnamed protein product [Rotaria sp. Silwood1]CAF5105662.1 unnamed protein product [Rotaria sp. Silwood1]
MDNPTGTINSLYQYENIEDNILNKLKKLRQHYPERFPLSIHVLATVHDTIDGEWQQRLRQAMEQRNRVSIFLIPYQMSNFNWIVVIIKFKTDGQVERAEFIDPLRESNLDIDKLQIQFGEIYPGIILQPRSIRKQEDREKSIELTIETLLKLAEEYQTTNINDLHDKTIGDQNANDRLNKEKGSFPILTANGGNRVRHQYSKQIPSVNIQHQLEQLVKVPQTELHNSNWNDENCPITEESLRNMQEDFSSMPSCSEKSIIFLLYYLSLKLISNPIGLDRTVEVPDQIKTKIDKEFEHLKERLKIEEENSKEIHNFIQELTVDIKQENWRNGLILLRKIFKKISPLNIHELFRLIKKVNSTVYTIKKKDIIFFLGLTGSGKSTTIHFLAGSKMIEIKVSDLYHIAPVEINNPDLKYITTSPFAKSETRHITSVEVKLKNTNGLTKESIILCDSPGFEDTSGPEVDIANGLGIVNVIKVCTSVKPVVVISYKSIGDRLQGLKNLIHVLSALIPGIRDQIEAFSYIFTKFPEKEKDTIHAFIKEIHRKLKDDETSDKSFMFLLEDILQKTRQGARVLDPINDKHETILDELIKSIAIDHPENVFQFSITGKSKTTLQEQLTKHQLNIRSATERSEYELVKYRLDQLKCLNDLLGQHYIEQVYNDCLRHISRYLSEEYERGISAMKRCLMSQTSLNDEDIRQYQVCIDHAKLAKEVQENHLGIEVISSTAFIEDLNRQVDLMLLDVREKDVDDISIRMSLEKIKTILNAFPDLDSKKLDNICQVLLEKLDSLVVSFKKSISSNKFDEAASHITKLYRAIDVLQDHLDREEIKAKYVQLKEYFLHHVNDCLGKLKYIFTQTKLDKNDIDIINRCVCMLENAKNTFDLQSHIFEEEINKLYENLLSNIMIYFEEIIKRINVELENENSFHVE